MAVVCNGGAPRVKLGVAYHHSGPATSKGNVQRGPSRTWGVHFIWHGRPICRVVGDAIVPPPPPGRPVSLKIDTQIQIQISPPSPPPPPPPPSPPLSPLSLPTSPSLHSPLPPS